MILFRRSPWKPFITPKTKRTSATPMVIMKVLKALKRGGRYVSSGAIGGPIVSLDMRTFYLKDLTMIGCTAWEEPVFPNLIYYIERGELRPLLAKTFPLECIADAQREFLQKKHCGNFVLIPPPLDA